MVLHSAVLEPELQQFSSDYPSFFIILLTSPNHIAFSGCVFFWDSAPLPDFSQLRGVVFIVCPLLAGEGVLFGLRGEQRSLACALFFHEEFNLSCGMQ